MKMTWDHVEEFDRKMLADFHSMGSWAHQYTATALYKQMQAVPNDSDIEAGDKPRIQGVLRAKILGEVAASMETLGRFCWALATRSTGGFSAAFINMSKNRANNFYSQVQALASVDADAVLTILKFPGFADLAPLKPETELRGFLDPLSDLLDRIADAYMDNGGSNPTENRKLANTYNAIKHGSHIVANPIMLSDPLTGAFDRQSITVIRRWPELNEDINDTTMVFVQRGLKQQSVTEDVQLTRTIATILSNLCQLSVLLIDNGLFYSSTSP